VLIGIASPASFTSSSVILAFNLFANSLKAFSFLTGSLINSSIFCALGMLSIRPPKRRCTYA